MSSYYIPRNVKGEGRLLNIFSTKALIYTVVTTTIGVGFYFLFAKLLGLTAVGIGFVVFFAIVGFAIGTFKIPDIPSIKVTSRVSGENMDDIMLRAFKFYRKNKRIYIYTKEDENGDSN